MTLFGTADVDCRLRFGEALERSRGESDLDESDLSLPAFGERLPGEPRAGAPPLL